MKADIHPNYRKLMVQCACGNQFETRSTAASIHVEVCAQCHPLLYRQAAPGGHRRPGRPVPPEVSDRAGRNAQGVNHGGPAPPGTDAGG